MKQKEPTLREKSQRKKSITNYKIYEEDEIDDDGDVRDGNISEDICILCREFG